MDNINQCSHLWIDERYLVETKLQAGGLLRERVQGAIFPFFYFWFMSSKSWSCWQAELEIDARFIDSYL